jgi:signal transduction histidine kinase
LILVLVGAIALLLGGVVGRSSQNLVDATVAASFAGSAELALQELHRLEETARAAAEVLAADPVVRAASRQERTGRLHTLAAVLGSVPGISAAYVGWPNGDFMLLRPVGRLGERLRPPAGARWLVQWAGTGGAKFDFLDTQLKTIESRAEPGIAFDPRTRPWFADAANSAGTILTAPYVFFTTREPGITAARKAETGAIAGVDLALRELSERLPRGRPAASAVAAVLDRQGRVVAYGDVVRLQAIVDRTMSGTSPGESGALPETKELGSAVLEALAGLAKTARARLYDTIDAGGREWVATVVPLDARGTSFVMAAPADELGSGVRSIRARLLQVLGLALLIVVPAVWLVSAAIARPVERFADEVGKIARLDFAPPPQRPARVSEIAKLDDSIRAMRSSLRERIKELRCLYRVLELTSDPARPASDICDDVARFLPSSMLHEDVAVARIVADGREHRSENWRAPAAALRAPIAGTRQGAGFVEVGYRDERPDQRGGEGPFLEEERELVDAVAAHVARMLQGRTLSDALARSERLGAVGRLTGGIAHDFNNLLTVILGNAELLREKLAGMEPLRRLADTTAKAAERGAELTQQLLAFSRRQALQPKLVDVNRLIAGMDGLLQRALSARVEMRLALAPELWRALVDPAQLEAAILNLCINARDAMPDGGTITIATASIGPDAAQALAEGELERGEYVSLAVSDTGIGMDRATAERAFEPFFTTKDVGKGTGLGLSMVYGFAKQSKGHVRIASERGRGTTVTIYLPRANAVGAADDADAAKAPARAAERGSERILFVEDDNLVREHVHAQLEELGYRVTAVASGREAMAALARAEPFDLLFTDVAMPGGMSGADLARAARASRPALPVLFTSGFTGEAGAALAEIDQAAHLLRKPFRRDELAAKLRTVLT